MIVDPRLILRVMVVISFLIRGYVLQRSWHPLYIMVPFRARGFEPIDRLPQRSVNIHPECDSSSSVAE